MSHSSSDSSLLHRHRPLSLQPQLLSTSPENEQTLQQRLHLETHESRHTPETFINKSNSVRSRANSNSCSSSPIIPSPQPIASTSSGMSYLNQDPTSGTSNDHAQPLPPLCPDGRSTDTLSAVRDGALGHMISRERWQPDCSSALCTHPFCTTIFAPTASYFALGPRRHHCRKCGLIFCSSHSKNKAMLYDTNNLLVSSRVCDTCINKTEDTHNPPLQSPRRASTSSDGFTDTSSAENLVTPSDLSLSRTSTRTTAPPSIITPGGSLAPVQGWMDKEGVLSLYPLALPPTSRKTAVPAARPLFSPSQAAMRIAKEKEQQASLNLRQRRLGGDADSIRVRSRRGSMASLEEEETSGLETRMGRVVSHDRMAQSTF